MLGGSSGSSDPGDSGQPGPAWSREAEALRRAIERDEPLPAAALRELLTALVDVPPPAVWHPTGFLVLTLLCRPHVGALRLHLWPERARQRGTPCWPVHDHVWDLRSHVLCGEVESRRYAVVDDPCGDAVLYAVRYGEGRSSHMARSERRVSVRPEAPRRIAAGERYSVPAGEFHASTVAVGRLAATLAATRSTTRAWPWVVGALDAPAVVPVERAVADAAWVRELLDAVRIAGERAYAPAQHEPLSEHEPARGA